MKRSSADAALVVLSVVLVAGCGGSSVGRSLAGRIRLYGMVSRGPTAPVCRVGVPCSAPAAGARLLFLRHERVAARVRVGKKGTYAVRLEPSVYTVRVRPWPRIGTGIRPQRVRVVSGPPRELNFWIDTGIR